MGGTFTGSLLFIAIIFHIVHSDEKVNFMEISKKTESISPNTTANYSEPATIIQHGNNVFIKPKFIIGSPFTSYKQENKPDGCCENVHTTSMLPSEETSMDIERLPVSQIPPVFMPPIILPSVIGNNVFIPPKLSIQSQTPIAPYPCFPFRVPVSNEELVVPVSCPPINLPPDVFLPPRYPIIVNKPIPPVVVPKPPELPPIILPKLPVEVIIQNPIFTNLPSRIPFPNQPVIVPHLCPPMVKCIVPERESPSIGDLFKVICDKFKNLLNIPNIIDLTDLVPQDEIVLTSDLPPAFPTICAQTIIAERLVPNIVRTNHDDVKVLMSPLFPSQLTSSGLYRNYKKG